MRLPAKLSRTTRRAFPLRDGKHLGLRIAGHGRNNNQENAVSCFLLEACMRLALLPDPIAPAFVYRTQRC